MLGQQLGHYRILERIGAGGMGEVYRAHDEQLDRDVALKALPAQALTDPTARARLLRKARSAAALNHPHICTIYEVGEAGGAHQRFCGPRPFHGKGYRVQSNGQRRATDSPRRAVCATCGDPGYLLRGGYWMSNLLDLSGKTDPVSVALFAAVSASRDLYATPSGSVGFRASGPGVAPGYYLVPLRGAG